MWMETYVLEIQMRERFAEAIQQAETHRRVRAARGPRPQRHLSAPTSVLARKSWLTWTKRRLERVA